MTHIVALLACHNRRELTLRCLKSFFSQSFTNIAPDLQAVLVDDGSSDGTADAVREAFPSVIIIEGHGSLYWAGAMAVAEKHAIVLAPDYLLWLNDDVTLDEDAIERLLDTSSRWPNAIVVGALRDPDSCALTYSGVVRSRWHPLRTSLVGPSEQALEADTFNGNVVLVPRVVYASLGGIDGAFSHAQADFDYGLRARRAGFRVVVAPRTCGTCRREGKTGTFEDVTLPLRRRWALVRSPTGLPMRSHARYLRRHGGAIWPVFWLAPYLKLMVSALFAVLARRRMSG
ncbi:MAG: glycosyltransferase family 2 protein [Thermomicrobium sp.]|nr:glycosyltransferase family 2 protein [Thermomicrobium sp.]